MKKLVQYIKETLSNKSAYDGADFFSNWYYDKMNYKYYNEDTGIPSLEELADAYFTTNNVTGDPSFLDVNGVTFSKIKDNKWQSESAMTRVIGGSKTDKELYQALKDTKSPWFAMLRKK